MWTYHPELLAVPVPRYTSFPTAAEFGEGVGAKELATALEGENGEVSLYVHIPFCEQICWYCGCNTSAANRSERVSSYLDALHREIGLIAERLPRAARVTRIAFGGGSPNSISPIDFVRLVDALTLDFAVRSDPGNRPVISIELDPRTFGPQWAAVIGAVGITRASLGVQTFDPALQQAIGRVQPSRMIENATAVLRGAGVDSLNFDLMYGLPGQTLAQLRDSLEQTVALGADRVALFGYAHVPHLIARQKQIDDSALPDAEARFGMAAYGYEYLVDQGYVPVGFDHFARPGDALAQASVSGTLRRNFQGFTEDQAPVLIGLGASAISSFPDLLVQNEKNAGRYRMMLSQERLTANRGIVRTAEDRRRGAVIEALLCRGRARIEPDLQQEALPLLRPYLDAGLCQMDGDHLAVLPGGLPYVRSIAARFDPYRKDSLRRFSSAV
ncbi:oxygen-independent coproporphyrinogen III oxidase [Novosphingobium mangrovi (ex Huang et al. 2023)]|uniref:Coproporphyrinogen-III oxidase n=1 Tax=Novosphingobium mangrovi (ex Huang et al. 2023) TaxID=2976432 RepID=A0ABT2I1C7_9SPHN|nr:oxygen-independent coproporphyrinogen III oxidase [Novosphingobium mangrovi (ex Huang et al. 2023)]MCT2398606.1 oxygen-independent coproporphyrinogen III oxidase [Novosphingobium mangrovi (ex Huang et al. 2023)]